MTSDDYRLEILKKDQEISLLNKEVELLNAQRRAIEENLNFLKTRDELKEKQLKIGQSIGTLKMDWLEAAKKIEALKDNPDDELRTALCIEFANELRPAALASLTEDPDSIVAVKAVAYEVFFRACVVTMQNRDVKLTINKRDDFNTALRMQKEAKNEKSRNITLRKEEKEEKSRTKERVKIEREKTNDPREKMIQSMLVLGMSREDAERQADFMVGKAKELVK